MYINTFKYKPEHVDCKLCTEYVKKQGCPANGCPWLAERIEAGVVDYREMVMETFSAYRCLTPRLNLLVKLFPGTLWTDEAHRQRMEGMKAQLGYRRRRDTPTFYAAMFLLTSNAEIYERAANCFCKQGFIAEYARMKDVAPHDYALYVAARHLCTGAGGVSPEDLADPEIIDPEAFRLIVNAMLIARYGLTALNIRAHE